MFSFDPSSSRPKSESTSHEQKKDTAIMTHPTIGAGWRPAHHPTLKDFFCLLRRAATGQHEQLGNRMAAHPPVEAFATREQAERVAEHLASKAE